MIDLKKSKISLAHSKYFDMWRGGASIIVALAHTFQIFYSKYPIIYERFSSAFAGAAVMAFFVLSGFFIHKSITRCFSEPKTWHLFVKARVERIIPPFVFGLALTLFLWVLAPLFFISESHLFITPINRTEFSLDGFWRTLFFTNNFTGPAISANGPLWSLTYEVWYYAIACLFSIAIVVRRSGAWIPVSLLILLSILDYWFFILGLVWLGGFILSILHANDCLPDRSASKPISVFLMVLLLSMFFVPNVIATKVIVVFHLAFGCFMINHMASVLKNTSKPPLIDFLVRSGSFSYTLYVIHFPILLFCYGTYENYGLLAFALTLIVSAKIGPKLEKIKFW